MPEISFKIAGITVKLSGNCPAETLRIMEGYRVREAFPGRGAGGEVGNDRDVTDCGRSDLLCVGFEVVDRIKALDLDPVYSVRHFIEEFGTFGENFVSQDRSGDESLATLVYGDDFHDVSCSVVDVEDVGGASLESRVNVALGECFTNCLPAFGALTYHASAIAFDGSALLFAAPSGTGKSTQTALWRSCFPERVVYINDDAPVIRRKDGLFYAYGTPWAGTSGINTNVSAPVKAIIYVERGTENSVRPLDGREKFIRAMCSVREQRFPVQRQRQTQLLFEFINAVPVYSLRCDISRGAVEVVKSLLF